MTPTFRHALVYSRAQDALLAPRVSVEAYHFRDVEPAALLYGAALTPVTPFTIPTEGAANKVPFAIAIADWPATLAQPTVQRLHAAVEQTCSCMAPGLCVLRIEGTHWHGDGRFDLAMLMALMKVCTGWNPSIEDCDVYGALDAHGNLVAPKDRLLTAVMASAKEQRYAVIPAVSVEDCASLPEAWLMPVENLATLAEKISERPGLRFKHRYVTHAPPEVPQPRLDMHELQAPASLKEALCIAAAGAHCMRVHDDGENGESSKAELIGQAIAGVLPLLRPAVADAQAGYASLNVRGVSVQRWGQHQCHVVRPGITDEELLGNAPARVGVASLAEHGVLVMQRAHEFAPEQLQHIQWAAEGHGISVGSQYRRGKVPSIHLPSFGQLILVLPACPHGHPLSADGHLTCTADCHAAYLRKMSPGLIDRCAMELHLSDMSLSYTPSELSSFESRLYGEQQVLKARQRQQRRVARLEDAPTLIYNGQLASEILQQLMPLEDGPRHLLEAHVQTHGWSHKKRNAVWAVAATVSDFADHYQIAVTDIARAVALCGG
jgi:predicted ATPase with chaperone activity